MTTIINSIPFDDIVVWNNSERENVGCYGRFAAVEEAKHDLIYTQDDDVLVPIARLVQMNTAFWKRPFMVNVPEDEEWSFLGWGAIFRRDQLKVLDRYIEAYGDEGFNRIADIAFAYQLQPYRVWVGALNFPWAEADNRMYKQPEHYDVRVRARDRALSLR